MERTEIAACMAEIAVLLELKGDGPFKVRAYDNAARILENLEEDLGELVEAGTLTSISGIGDALAQKIEALYTTGELDFYNKLKASIPAGVIELLDIQGLGAKKVKALYHKLGIESLDALRRACEEGKVAELSGFGKKTQDNILSSINHLEVYRQRHLWSKAEPIVNRVLEGLRGLPEVERADCAGSFRRNAETVGDVDFLVAAEDPAPVMEWFTTLEGVESVTAKGDTKSSVRMASGLQMDLRVVPLAQFFFALHHFTGSKDHNIKMRQRALSQGFSLSEWGVTAVHEQHEGPVDSVDSEADLFRLFGLEYIPPSVREGGNEIEYAAERALPEFVKAADIRGLFHCHTQASDGKDSLEDMVRGAEALGMEYLGITDHSKSSVVANGLSVERLLEQGEQIRALNASGDFKTHVFAGVECDILKDGTLDYESEVLDQLDFVIAAVHSSFGLSEKEMTARVVRALEQPSVTMLAHPTGRLLLEREPYAINMPKVIDAAIANGKIIEINASPRRLDMDWRLWHKAAERGLMTSINPDAHAVEHLPFFYYGVNVARKGWLEPKHILNTRSLAEVTEFLKL